MGYPVIPAPADQCRYIFPFLLASSPSTFDGVVIPPPEGVEEDGDEEIVAVINIEEAIDNEKVHDCQLYLGYDTNGKHIIGVHTEKGSFNGEAELDVEDFDEEKITFGLVNLADNWFIVNSIQYDGEEIEMEGDSTGKSSEYYKFEDDETEYIC